MRLAIASVLCLLAWGCSHRIPINGPLAEYQETGGYRLRNHRAAAGTNTDSLYVCLVFSGGGTRAAALSFGVLEALRTTPIKWGGVEKTLLDEVDLISSVSGGSFTAAYYGLFGDSLFDDYPGRFLNRNIQGQLIGRVVFRPWNWVRLLSPRFSRIDLAAELYHHSVFERKTFADLESRVRGPFLIINATHLADGTPFNFTQDQFDLLGSDLGPYSVAKAVAASSAFPFLLNAVTLRNYATPGGADNQVDIETALNSYHENRRRYRRAVAQTHYLDKQTYRFIHLMDGGMADNIGLRPVEALYKSDQISSMMDDGAISKFVVIVVNAKTGKPGKISRKRRPPGLISVAYKTATISMGNYSDETIEEMKDLLKERGKDQDRLDIVQKMLDERGVGDPPLPRLANVVDLYLIEVAFEAIPDTARREYFHSLPTSFRLPAEDIDSLRAIGEELLKQSPEFDSLMAAIGQPSKTE